MLFRLFRLPLLLLAAFAAGVYYERAQRQEACTQSDGYWSDEGYCTFE